MKNRLRKNVTKVNINIFENGPSQNVNHITTYVNNVN